MGLKARDEVRAPKSVTWGFRRKPGQAEAGIPVPAACGYFVDCSFVLGDICPLPCVRALVCPLGAEYL